MMRPLIFAFLLLPAFAAAQTAPDKKAVLDKLLDALRTAPTEEVASALEVLRQQPTDCPN